MPGCPATFAYIVGQGPVVLAAGAGRVGYIYIFFFYIFHLSSISNVLSLGDGRI